MANQTASEALKSMDTGQLRNLVEGVVRQAVDGKPAATAASGQRVIPIGISARHLHISQADLEKLFGPGYHLTKMKDLNQPGEFAANETVTVIGPKRRIYEKIRILGPTRPATQVELSFTDGIYLGIPIPARISGDTAGSAPITLIGPAGVLELKEGAIRALRHIHMNPENAAAWGITNGQKVNVKTSGVLGVTFNDVVVRIKENLNLEMHVDTDEANAAGLNASNGSGILV